MKKLAMIGCGGIGSYHLSHFVQFKDIVELAGFCDLIPERAESFVQQAGGGKLPGGGRCRGHLNRRLAQPPRDLGSS